MLTILLSMLLAAVPITVETEVQADTVDYIFYVDDERVDPETARIIKLADIKTITTIKGDAAVEHYGSEARDGVIVIQTKKGATKSRKKAQTTTHEYVDLGLSVKWATCNVGAGKPEEYGDYYAWGEVMPKRGYTWANYRFFKSGTSNNDVQVSKYSLGTGYGVNDRKSKLDLEDDVAHVKWGGNWRMPTKTEMEELRNNCTWAWTIIDGVPGFKVTSNKKGYKDRYIFLPAAGYKDIAKDVDVGLAGHYWTSSLGSIIYISADILYCFPNVRFGPATAYRYYGLPVRPVCP